MRVDVKGVIIPNDYKEWYDFWNEDCTCPRDIQEAVDTLPESEDLDVYINSPGGEIASGSEIYTILRACSRVKIHITGQAHSAASIIAMAGWSEMSPTALMMVHCVSTYGAGNHSDFEHTAEVLRSADEALCTAYTAKTGMTKEEALEMMEHETWMTAETAKERGLVDAVMFENAADAPMAAAEGLFRLPTKEQLAQLRNEKRKKETQKETRLAQTKLDFLKLTRR